MILLKYIMLIIFYYSSILSPYRKRRKDEFSVCDEKRVNFTLKIINVIYKISDELKILGFLLFFIYVLKKFLKILLL